MIYNLPKAKTKFEETWVLNSTPAWKSLFSAVSEDSRSAVVNIKFTSNDIDFDGISIQTY